MGRISTPYPGHVFASATAASLVGSSKTVKPPTDSFASMNGPSRTTRLSPRVRTVVGQTLPSLVASIGVLEKAGFAFTGAGDDPQAPPGEQVIRYAVTREQWSQQPPPRVTEVVRSPPTR